MTGLATCPCLTSPPTTLPNGGTVLLAAQTYDYASTYGLNKCAAHDATLAPYWHELMLYLAQQLRDPFPALKIEAAEILWTLADPDAANGFAGMLAPFVEQLPNSIIPYASAMARVALPCLRHRHAKVRHACLGVARSPSSAIALIAELPNPRSLTLEMFTFVLGV